MGIFTAQILVGHDHRNHGGIIPSHAVYWSENSRPAWILDTIDLFSDDIDKKKVCWIPKVDNMLEDAMLLIGIHVIKDETVIRAEKKNC